MSRFRRIGLISDTHGLLRPEALRAIAPICVVHDLKEFAGRPCRVVVSGHSHKARIEEREGVLYVNPGSAGPRRFTLPVTLGELKISGASVRARIQEVL